MQLYYLCALVAGVGASLTPPVLPLIVRSPYLSTWLGRARDPPWEQWPIFYTGANIGFSVMASVPDSKAVYPLLGRPQDSLSKSSSHYKIKYPTYRGASFDASTTNLTYLVDSSDSAGDPLELTLSFLSPVTPTSTFRQSLPAAYMTVLVKGSFDVDIYVDVNGQWVSGNGDNEISWELGNSGAKEAEVSTKTFKVKRSVEQILTEFEDRSEWGTLHFSGPSDVSHQSGASSSTRQQFAAEGSLSNQVDSSHRKILENGPVFAFSKSFRLGGKSDAEAQTADSALFTLALVQNPVVQFASARGLTLMRPFWASYFDSADAMVEYHYSDFAAASFLARHYSDQLAQDAYLSGSEDYQDIAALSARQVLGATQFSGTPENPIIFLKEISSNGNFQTVDVIYPAFPFFLYTNPKWLAYLLEPLMEHMMSGQYPRNYSMHDLGTHFPNATGHPDGRDEYMPVEECGNMLIMGLALVNAFREGVTRPFVPSAESIKITLAETSKRGIVDERGMDKSWTDNNTSGSGEAKKWIKQTYKLWKQWTGYLVDFSLVPSHQLCTDDFAGALANQTNLALKGIIGIRAMSELANLVGEEQDAKRYREISEAYITKWQDYGIARDGSHAKLAYTWYGSWTTIYNLYADALLCFHLPQESKSAPGAAIDQVSLDGDYAAVASSSFIPDKVYQVQSDWYHAVLQRYGLPLDSRHLYSKSDWEFFAAAVTGKKTRQEILTSVARWVNETATDRPLTDLYETEGDGGFPGLVFTARPVVGGHFAFLALERACGGKAVEGLHFLDKRAPADVDVEWALLNDAQGDSRGSADAPDEL